ncbi:MAG: outer membrane protein assembly factor [Paraprevotella sp.]|nr:outer membrane protein assembly factor [Paraprevotella sp.]
MRKRIFCVALLCGLSCMLVRAEDAGGRRSDSDGGGCTEDEVDSVPSVAKPVSRSHNPLKWIGRYLSNTNKHDPRPFDFSMIIGPSYSAATSAGLGATASGLYSWDRSDPSLPKSNVSVFANASLSGMLAIGLRGNNFLPHQKYRFDYQLSLYTFPGFFWGIGYENGANDANKSDYERVKLQFKPDFLFQLNKDLFLGPVVDIEWVNSFGFENEVLLEGQDKTIANYGAGFNLTYDTRDFVLNAYRGNYFRWEQMFYPSKLGNDYAFSYTDLTYSTYHQVWKGGVLAMELHALFNYGDVPWTMMAQVGVLGRMRGYYEGRYRDRNIMEGQLELRQHIKGRNGIVVWGGLANVFHNFDRIYFNQILPNYGVGYRWEFKKRVNIRFDLGFTKDSPNFTFNINEAF